MAPGKIVAIIGFIALAGLGVWNAAPLFYDKEVQEDLPGMEQESINATETSELTTTSATSPSTLSVLAEGSFTGFDSLHDASGTARIVEVDGKRYVRFEEDFSVTNGPDLYVHFGKDGKYAAEANLGRLKGNKGSQNYEIPADISIEDYNEVWIWCRAFAVPFGTATYIMG